MFYVFIYLFIYLFIYFVILTVFNYVCVSAFEEGHLDPWRSKSALIIISLLLYQNPCLMICLQLQPSIQKTRTNTQVCFA